MVIRNLNPGRRILLLVVLLMYCAGLLVAQPVNAPMVQPIDLNEEERIENKTGLSVLIFTPHPDDETFAMGGTIARLVENGNIVNIVIYTNDNKGSLDLSMTRERLARIRRAEEEESCRLLGVPSENIHWLGYEDGDLEYADPKDLRGQVARLIKVFRPHAVFSPDPGAKWVQWHKTDHRMAANITQDAFIAAEWHLYYPQHYLDENLEPYSVPEVFYYYSQEPNYEIDITLYFDKKIMASAAHVSQFEPSVSQYTPILPDTVLRAIDEGFRMRNKGDNEALVERFRKG